MGWKAATIDVKTAFLLVPIETSIHVRLPDKLPKTAMDGGFVPQGIYKLRKALYGLKEAPRLFEIYLTQKLNGLGYSRIDDGVHFREDPIPAYLVTYVDDVMCWSPDPLACLEEIKGLIPCAEIQEIGRGAVRYIGEDILSPEDGVIITTMTTYMKSLPPMEEFVKDVPLHYAARKLSSRLLPLDGHTEDFDTLTQEERTQVVDAYRRIVGTLGWLASAHPAIAYTFGELARYSSSPGPTAFRIAAGTLRELAQSTELYITLGPVHDPQLRLWVDAALRNTKSRRGWILQLTNRQEPLSSRRNLMAWRSVKDDTPHHSSVNAEVNAIYQAILDVKDVLYTIRALYTRAFGSIPIVILTDSMSGRLQILNDTGSKEDRGRSDYIRHFMVSMGMSNDDLRHVPGTVNLADPLTKPLRFDWYNKDTDLT